MDRDLLTPDERQLLRMPSGDMQPNENALGGLVAGATSGLTDGTEGSLSPEPEQEVVEIHARLSDALSRTVSDMVRQPVSTRLRDDWVGTYSEFIFHQPLPTCCAVMTSAADEMELYWYMEPTLLFSLLDRMLGADPGDLPAARVLSEIEQALAGLLFQQIGSCYAELWKQALAQEFVVDRLIHNAQQLRCLRGNDPCYIARYELSCGRHFGRLELCLPWNATHCWRFVV